MKQSRTFLILALVVAVLALGIAYAAITSVTLNVNGNVLASAEQGNFKVSFIKDGTGAPSFNGKGTATLAITNDTTATMDVSGLSSIGDTLTATFTIKNTSDDLTATLVATPSNSNPEYFEVTPTLGSTTVDPVDGTTTLQVAVKLIKTPLADQKATIGIAIVATPSN